MTTAELITAVVTSLTTELSSDPDFSSAVLTEKVTNAVDELLLHRGYAKAGYSDTQIEADIENYKSVVRNVALYDYNQSGIEFQTSSQENGNQRTFMNRNNLFNGVVPISRIV